MPHCRFLIHGATTPDLPLRLLNMFAQQDLAVERAEISRARDRYRVSIEIDRLAPDKARVIMEKMRVMVQVDQVELFACGAIGSTSPTPELCTDPAV